MNRLQKSAALLAVTLLLQPICTANLYAQPEPPAPLPIEEDSDQDKGADAAADSGSGTEINVKNADLGAIIKIFSKKTKRNYILDESVKGKVTIHLPAKVSDSESVRILEAILSLKGYTSVPIGENLWKIVPSKDARKSTIPTITDDEADSTIASAAIVTRLVQLKYVNAEDVQKLLSQLVSNDGLINAYSRTNSLIIVDSDDNARRLIEIAKSVDIASSDRDMTIIPIKHADAQEVADTILQILGEAKDAAAGSAESPLDLIRARIRQTSITPNGANPGMPMEAAGDKNVSVSGGSAAVKVIPDSRTNSIIVVADETDTARIRALIMQLDSEIDLSGFRYYVYRCQHASAEELADVLAGLVGEGSSGGSGTGSSSRSSGEDRSLSSLSGFNEGSSSSRRLGSNSTSGRNTSQTRTPGQARSSGAGSGSVSSVKLDENVSITADPATNSLIIASNKSDYEKVLELLSQLDVKRRQVLVEAMLLEVSISEAQKMGTEFIASAGGSDGGVMASSNFGNLTGLLSDPTKLADFSVAAASSGSLTLPGNITIPTQTLLINAAKSNTNVNVLSAPNIMTTDNEEAEIVVGQNVPFLASTSSDSTNLNNTFNQVDRQDVGITLRITPQISSGDSVNLNIFTEVSNVVESTAESNLGPTTTVRTSQTTVITRDGQMVVIGGLMSDDVNQIDRGVPILKDLPVLGTLFRFTAEARRRTNLLIFITPRVIKDQFDSRDLTVTKRESMEDIIADNDVRPDRQELLHSVEMDHVAEASEYKGPKPTTIKPPLSKSSGSTLSELKSSDSARRGSEDEIELKVTPKLPGEVGSFTPSLNTNSQRASLKGGMPSKVVSSGNARYIVLKSEKPKGGALPFDLGKGLMAGVLVPAGSSVSAQQFFTAGSKLAYQDSADSQLPLAVMGVFSSEEEARTTFPELEGSWYTLSPYEIMGLGSGPWITLK